MSRKAKVFMNMIFLLAWSCFCLYVFFGDSECEDIAVESSLNIEYKISVNLHSCFDVTHTCEAEPFGQTSNYTYTPACCSRHLIVCAGEM